VNPVRPARTAPAAPARSVPCTAPVACVGPVPPARTAGLLPAGTVPVGAGLALLGAGSWAHLAIAGHALSPAGYSGLSVLWTVVFAVGLGLFVPIEQEVARLVAARAVTGGSAAAVYRPAAALAATVLGAVVLVLVAAAGPLSRALFDGQRAMVPVLAGGLAGLAVAHPVRGVLAGTGRFGGYGRQLATDGGLRIALAGGLGLAGVRWAPGYGLVLAVAPVLAVLVTARAAGWRGGGPAVPLAVLLRGLAPLTASALLAQVVINAAVLDARLLAPGRPALAGALLSGLVLARLPVFAFAAVQAALLPGLARLAAAGRRDGFGRLLRRAVVVVAALSLAGGVPAILAGPALTGTVFGTATALRPRDFALLALGTAGYLLALVLGGGLQALGRHRALAGGWLAGAAALAVVTALPGPVPLRVGCGYAAGTLAACAVLGMVLRAARAARR